MNLTVLFLSQRNVLDMSVVSALSQRSSLIYQSSSFSRFAFSKIRAFSSQTDLRIVNSKFTNFLQTCISLETSPNYNVYASISMSNQRGFFEVGFSHFSHAEEGAVSAECYNIFLHHCIFIRNGTKTHYGSVFSLCANKVRVFDNLVEDYYDGDLVCGPFNPFGEKENKDDHLPCMRISSKSTNTYVRHLIYHGHTPQNVKQEDKLSRFAIIFFGDCGNIHGINFTNSVRGIYHSSSTSNPITSLNFRFCTFSHNVMDKMNAVSKSGFYETFPSAPLIQASRNSYVGICTSIFVNNTMYTLVSSEMKTIINETNWIIPDLDHSNNFIARRSIFVRNNIRTFGDGEIINCFFENNISHEGTKLEPIPKFNMKDNPQLYKSMNTKNREYLRDFHPPIEILPIDISDYGVHDTKEKSSEEIHNMYSSILKKYDQLKSSNFVWNIVSRTTQPIGIIIDKNVSNSIHELDQILYYKVKNEQNQETNHVLQNANAMLFYDHNFTQYGKLSSIIRKELYEKQETQCLIPVHVTKYNEGDKIQMKSSVVQTVEEHSPDFLQNYQVFYFKNCCGYGCSAFQQAILDDDDEISYYPDLSCDKL